MRATMVMRIEATRAVSLNDRDFFVSGMQGKKGKVDGRPNKTIHRVCRSGKSAPFHQCHRILPRICPA